MLCALLVNEEKGTCCYAVKVSGSFTDGTALWSLAGKTFRMSDPSPNYLKLICYFPSALGPEDFIDPVDRIRIMTLLKKSKA